MTGRERISPRLRVENLKGM